MRGAFPERDGFEREACLTAMAFSYGARTPHPPFGHLLPACGEKGDKSSVYFPLPLASLAGRGWREAPGEGRSHALD